MIRLTRWLGSLALAALLIAPLTLRAQNQQNQGQVTATCKDGTAFSGTTKRGACRGHGGVQAWTSPGQVSPSPAAAAPAGEPSATKATPPTQTGRQPSGVTPSQGQVWVNTSSKVYHCAGDRWYGKTKHGEYMSEVQAKEQGNRPSHGKACS
jgi:hypothetical protein